MSDVVKPLIPSSRGCFSSFAFSPARSNFSEDMDAVYKCLCRVVDLVRYVSAMNRVCEMIKESRRQ